jgi:hypothetical protein
MSYVLGEQRWSERMGVRAGTRGVSWRESVWGVVPVKNVVGEGVRCAR